MARVCSDLGGEGGVAGGEEEEVELSLGLSIGRSFKKPDKQRSVFPLTLPPASSETKSAVLEGRDRDPSFCRSDASPAFTTVDLKGSNGGGGDLFDQQRRKEIHALRRQEARRKREEKQQKKGFCRGRNGVSVNNHVLPALMDDRTVLEAQEFQSRVRDRAAKENEASWSQNHHKKSGEDCGNVDQNVTLTLSPNQNLNYNPNPNPSSSSPASLPSVMSTQYPFHPMQCMPFANGFVYPYMMPCWGPPAVAGGAFGGSNGGDGLNGDKGVFHPVASRSFRPFQVKNPNQNLNQVPSCDSELSGGNGDSGVKQSSLGDSGSQETSSSAVSENQSGSLHGAGSSDTRSHTSRFPSEQPQSEVSPIQNGLTQIKQNASTNQIESTQVAEESTDRTVSNTVPAPTNSLNEPVPTTTKPPISPNHAAVQNQSEAKKPNSCPPPSLPQMPCVSTTGNGPNGKTITGFLYRYTKTEVSIVCVCHGSFFSPAEFVKHAGGTDISHPLRHIVVAPSAFG